MTLVIRTEITVYTSPQEIFQRKKTNFLVKSKFYCQVLLFRITNIIATLSHANVVSLEIRCLDKIKCLYNTQQIII